MFPYTDNRPARTPQLLRNGHIPIFIGGNLLSPESCIVFGPDDMVRASVPEATIDKDYSLVTRQGQIRFPREL
jgi:hypothetical protein